MIYRESQLRIFKNVQRREWLRQNRMREPFIKQWRQRLTKYFTDLGNNLKEDYAYGSNTLVNIRINESSKILRNIMRVQYIIVANAFKNFFLDRTQNVKDFDTEFETRLDTYIENNVGTLVTNINENTRNKIQSVIGDSFDTGQSIPETGNALRNTLIGMGVYRANLIARTEVHRTASFANEIAAESMGIAGTKKEWVAVRDARTRVAHLVASGQKVGLEEPFIVGGEQLKYPGDPAGSPGNTINCRCVSIYTTPDFL